MCEVINVQVNVMVAMSMLKRLGLAADVAYNGLEAIKALQTKCYDLVQSHNSLHPPIFVHALGRVGSERTQS
jgi:CheY-like chemotaxis protein